MAETITIDGKKYEKDKLSDEAKAHLNSLQAADREIASLKSQLAIAQTARNAYANALKDMLPKEA